MISSLRIVLVEDERLFRQMLAQYLRRECGCNVAGEAPDGAKGLALCLEINPDMALIDLQLPIMDGLALADRLHRQAPNIKLLALSSRLDTLTVYRVEHSPFRGFVDKNQSLAVLKQAIALVMAGVEALNAMKAPVVEELAWQMGRPTR